MYTDKKEKMQKDVEDKSSAEKAEKDKLQKMEYEKAAAEKTEKDK